MPVLVKNNSPGPAVFSDSEKNLLIEFGGAGDPDGRDYQEVPEDVIRQPSFARAIRNGVYSLVNVEGDEEVAKLLAPQHEAQKAALKKQQDEIQAVLDASNVEDDLVEARCLISGETIIVRQGDLKDKPPLAARYADRVDEFMRVETPGAYDAKGQPVLMWVRRDSAAAAAD